MQMRLNPNQTITIKRYRKHELDAAISDLLKKGYELVGRGQTPTDFTFKEATRGQYWARIKCVN